MKVDILQEDLQKGLSLGQRFITSRPQLPILANFLLETDNGQLKLSATDLNLGISIWMDAKVEEKGCIAIPARDISEFVAYLQGTLRLETEKQILRVISPRAEASFAGMKGEEFPRPPQGNEKNKIIVPTKRLTLAVDEVSFAAARDETRPILEGILWKMARAGYELVATDGYRLAWKKVVEKQALKTEEEFLVPARSFAEVAKLVEGEERLTITWDQQRSQIIFKWPRFQLTSRLLAGEFPDYQKIIPQESKIQVFLDQQEFLTAIRAVSVFARQAANIIVLDFQSDQVIIQANAPQVGQNQARVPIRLEGQPLKVAFNYRFILDFLNNLPAEEKGIIIKLNDPLSPVVFSRDGDSSLLHLIMPVRLDH